MTWAIYALTLQPELQTRLRKEITDAGFPESPSYSDLDNMKFLNNFVKEVLRFYPPGTFPNLSLSPSLPSIPLTSPQPSPWPVKPTNPSSSKTSSSPKAPSSSSPPSSPTSTSTSGAPQPTPSTRTDSTTCPKRRRTHTRSRPSRQVRESASASRWRSWSSRRCW